MVNYENGKIYKIESHLGDKIYIGSTTKKHLSQRMDSHRSNYKRWKNDKCGKTYSFEVFDEYGVEHCKIVLLELYACSSKDELHARESHFIRTLTCVNKVIPDRTPAEYHKMFVQENKELVKAINTKSALKNKDKIAIAQKKYREEHKDEIKAQHTQPFMCECGCLIQRVEKPRHQRSLKHQKLLSELSSTN